MVGTRRPSFARGVGNHFKIILLVAASLRAGLLQADTIVLKTAEGSMAANGTIGTVDAEEVVFALD